MTTTTTRTAHIHDGADIAFTERGEPGAPAIVLLHSLGADGRMWDACVGPLSRDHHVIVPDSRGHGASAPASRTSVDLWVNDLEGVFDAAGVETAFLVGISLGGIQALAYAAAHPEQVRGLVIADSFVALDPDTASAKIAYLCDQARTGPMDAVADTYLADTFDSPYPPGAQQIREAIAGMEPASYRAAVEACFGVRIEDRLEHVEAPTLVLWGDHDSKTPRPLSERIVAGLRDARLDVVPDAGHLSSVDNPEAFVSHVARFLQEQGESVSDVRAEEGTRR